MDRINLVREIRELKTHLSYSKNIGFFFGAGTFCMLGILNVEQLTIDIESKLKKDNLANFKSVESDLATIITTRNVNIEDILNQIRIIRGLTGESKKKYKGVSGEDAKLLDKKDCSISYEIIANKESLANINKTKKFFAWLSLLTRDFSKEVFITNYDLIIETTLEESQIPYFDGFVDSYEPFFLQESTDQFVSKNDLTQKWIRL